jgi:uncharacterized repeat protein (TIGR01451 family)
MIWSGPNRCLPKICVKIGSLMLASMMIMIAISSADLSVENHNVRAGDTAFFTINVTNTGETDLNHICIIDAMPPGMSYVTDDHNPRGFVQDGNVTWANIGLLNIGESKLIHLVVHINQYSSGILINKVSVIGSPVPSGYNTTGSDNEYVSVSAPVPTIRFYNANGDYDKIGRPIYDEPDSVYLDFSIPSSSSYGIVCPGDIRLTGPT